MKKTVKIYKQNIIVLACRSKIRGHYYLEHSFSYAEVDSVAKKGIALHFIDLNTKANQTALGGDQFNDDNRGKTN